ncbi:signal transduction histidine kinase [Paenibacillus aceris]|uniref:histidine kinase n=1 Tax=Paenibacillus aceris TaxID=869555 RepID=A0ABS4I8B4_9BACL|nr:signal transduction histidine kinase [Paenibacillus aceris]
MKYQNHGRPMVISALIFFLMIRNQLFLTSLSHIALHLAIWLTITVSLFIRRSWWNRRRLAIAAGILFIECLIGIIGYQEVMLLYLIAIVVFAAALRRTFSKYQTSLIALMVVTAALYIRYGQKDLFNLLSFIMLAIVFYFSIRIRIQRNEAYEQNKRHLAELQVAYEQLQEASATSMQNAILEERTRIARDIHDAVGHSLTSIIVQMQALRYMIRESPAQAGQSIEEMLTVARQGLQDIRTSVHELADNRKAIGITALKSLLSRLEVTSSIRYSFQTNLHDEDLNADVYETLFRVLQESITNVIRHSNATFLEVSLTRDEKSIEIRIRDNGVMDTEHQIQEGFGLVNMKKRLEERAGRLQYRTVEPNGFELIATMPCNGSDQYAN